MSKNDLSLDFHASLEERLKPIGAEFHNDLMFAMSRGALELFTSNVLKYFLDHYPRESLSVRALFDANASKDDQLQVYREKRHLDLVAESESSRWVVENKVFSIPNRDQLKRYIDLDFPWASGAKPQEHPVVQYSLLSLFTTPFTLEDVSRNQNRNVFWKLVSYMDLVAELEKLNFQAFATPDDAMLLHRFRILIRRLVDLKDVVDPAKFLSEPFITNLDDPELKGTWLTSSAMKLRASAAVEEIGRRSGSDLPGEFGVGFSNGNATLEYLVSSAYSPKTKVAWQVQGTQLRLGMFFDEGDLHGRSPLKKERRIERTEEEWSDWFDFSAAGSIVDDPSLHPRDKDTWNHFAPSMVYKKRHISPTASNEDVLSVLAELTRKATHFAQSH